LLVHAGAFFFLQDLARQTELATSFAGDVASMTTEAQGYQATMHTLTQSVADWQVRKITGCGAEFRAP
jgi:hypothetical protein